MLETLRDDFSRLPALLALAPPTVRPPDPPPRTPDPADRPRPPIEPAVAARVGTAPKEQPITRPSPGKPAQLGLFE